MIAYPDVAFADLKVRRRAPETAHVVKLSGGAASAVTAAIVAEEVGAENVHHVFTDTLIEHNDLYRFLIEFVGRLHGVDVADLLPLALALPQVWEDERGRKAALGDLRLRACARLPMLHWLSDGRHPFEVFNDVRMMGSSRVDPCSLYLKRAISDAFIAKRWTPSTAVLYVGIAHHERARFEGRWERLNPRRLPARLKLLARLGLPADVRPDGSVFRPGIVHYMRPWECRSPLVGVPALTKPEMLGFLRSMGIEPARLYALGFPTNNCGGGCVKAGHAWWLHLLRTIPPMFFWWERNEAGFIARTGNPRASILNDRRNGMREPYTLTQFREDVERQTDLTALFLTSDEGCGGGCALPSDIELARAA
ncbi:MAG TPA: hypothetical protein VFJ16_08315 [Longimicrobium sp.]|nr:hypothetical protein [Longimicrobium sp.]